MSKTPWIKPIKKSFRRAHLYIFVVIWLLFSVFTFVIANGGIDDAQSHGRLVCYTTLGTILGPMTGAISRNWQGCCTKLSLSLMPYCGAILLLGWAGQLIRLPFEKGARALRLFLWIFGWLAWFTGGILSFLHAFS